MYLQTFMQGMNRWMDIEGMYNLLNQQQKRKIATCEMIQQLALREHAQPMPPDKWNWATKTIDNMASIFSTFKDVYVCKCGVQHAIKARTKALSLFNSLASMMG